MDEDIEEELDDEEFGDAVATGGVDDYYGYEEVEDSDDEESEEVVSVEEEGEEDPEALMETYWQGLQARARLKKLGMKGRKGGTSSDGKGRGKSSGRKKDRSKTICNDCKQKGHWSGDPECEHVKSGRVPPFRKEHDTGVVFTFFAYFTHASTSQSPKT